MDGTSAGQRRYATDGQRTPEQPADSSPQPRACSSQPRPPAPCDVMSSASFRALPAPGLIDVTCLQAAELPISAGGSVMLPDDIQAMIVPLKMLPLSETSGRMLALRRSSAPSRSCALAGGWPVVSPPALQDIFVPPMPDLTPPELPPGNAMGSGPASSGRAGADPASSRSRAALCGAPGQAGPGVGGSSAAPVERLELAVPERRAENPSRFRGVKDTDIRRSRQGTVFGFATGSYRRQVPQFATPQFEVIKSARVPFYQSTALPPLLMIVLLMGAGWWYVNQDMEDGAGSWSESQEWREARAASRLERRSSDRGRASRAASGADAGRASSKRSGSRRGRDSDAAHDSPQVEEDFRSPTVKSLEATWSSSEAKNPPRSKARRTRPQP